jgi:hypothetical protein
MANNRLESLDRRFSDRGIGADRAGFGSRNRYGGSLEPQFVQLLAQFLIVRLITFEYRNFDAVESSRFDLFQLGVVLLGYVSRPKQQIHANFHSRSSGGCCLCGDLAEDLISVLSRERSRLY